MYTLEEKRVGRFTVKLHSDEVFNTWEDVLCDEPVMILGKSRFRTEVLFDGSKQVPSGTDIYFTLEDSDWEESLSSVYGLDWEVLEDGRVYVDAYTLWDRPRYFKTLESAAKRVLEDDSGLDLRDLRFERFGTQDGEVLAIWSQTELDRYAGTKDAKFARETVRAYLDGEVYGWTVEDADGDVLDSCWGYIGDARDVFSEGEDVARGLEDAAQAEDANTLEASRADLYADA
jgi:hypothetical protein